MQNAGGNQNKRGFLQRLFSWSSKKADDMGYEDVLHFWFKELKPKDWFKKSKRLDKKIERRFKELHSQVAQGMKDDWKETPEGALALVIVLDQFSRNIFRDTKESFAYDLLALEMAKQAVAEGKDMALPKEKRRFLYMPYMHSESKEIHERAVKLFKVLGDPDALKYEMLHKGIIDRFGRYPHRNQILGRKSTDAERYFLEHDENASF